MDSIGHGNSKGKLILFFSVHIDHYYCFYFRLKDKQFWKEKMERTLKTFYFQCLSAKIIDPRYPIELGIHQEMKLDNKNYFYKISVLCYLK